MLLLAEDDFAEIKMNAPICMFRFLAAGTPGFPGGLIFSSAGGTALASSR